MIFLTAHRRAELSRYKHFHEIFWFSHVNYSYTQSAVWSDHLCWYFNNFNDFSELTPSHESQTLMREFFVCDLVRHWRLWTHKFNFFFSIFHIHEDVDWDQKDIDSKLENEKENVWFYYNFDPIFHFHSRMRDFRYILSISRFFTKFLILNCQIWAQWSVLLMDFQMRMHKFVPVDRFQLRVSWSSFIILNSLDLKQNRMIFFSFNNSKKEKINRKIISSFIDHFLIVFCFTIKI